MYVSAMRPHSGRACLTIAIVVALGDSVSAGQTAGTWNRVLPAAVATDVSAVAVDATNPHKIYAGRYGGGVPA